MLADSATPETASARSSASGVRATGVGGPTIGCGAQVSSVALPAGPAAPPGPGPSGPPTKEPPAEPP
eukprot:11205537-Lingulodinium_polyedra.AAC.1